MFIYVKYAYWRKSTGSFTLLRENPKFITNWSTAEKSANPRGLKFLKGHSNLRWTPASPFFCPSAFLPLKSFLQDLHLKRFKRSLPLSLSSILALRSSGARTLTWTPPKPQCWEQRLCLRFRASCPAAAARTDFAFGEASLSFLLGYAPPSESSRGRCWSRTEEWPFIACLFQAVFGDRS